MHDLRHISSLFDMRADFVDAHPYGSGHINDTYCAWYDQAGLRVRFIHQRINHNVFKRPIELMENVERVTRHALDVLTASGNPEARRRTLTCIPARDGKPYALGPDASVWRAYPFIERARGFDELETNRQAYEAARAFGAFQNLAAKLPGQRLHETIPDFHHTPKRLAALEAAIAADVRNRAADCKPEIAFALARAEDCAIITTLIAKGDIPERVTHNDTKLNNVLLDDVTAEGVCVIDLDTTMPGSALYDFGDMVRTAVATTREDDPALENLDLRLDRFEALVRGYLASAGSFLTSREKELLPFAGKLISFEIGLRFLTDWLEGDTYFKIKRPTHNLDRCRTQFKLVASIEDQLPAMREIVEQA